MPRPLPNIAPAGERASRTCGGSFWTTGMTDTAWKVVIQEKEKRYLAKLPRRERERLLDANAGLWARIPFAGDVAKLKGSREGTGFGWGDGASCSWWTPKPAR
jgi:hypothetical protein